MRGLTVLYDGDCGFCRRCTRWLDSEPQHVPLRFVAQGSDEARRRWPSLAVDGTPEELIVVDDAGGVYRAESAWIIVLYALRKHRRLSRRLAQPAMRPLARRVVHFIAHHRQRFSRLLGVDAVIDRAQQYAETPRCATAGCAPIAGENATAHLRRVAQARRATP